ncbi:hypothetical protein [Caulobacter sp. 17J80-11]|uniref:hypothetical protein n=1 Tax=Caulobacter sp. 17J80-11 TaxID=2763502 RepID=UPI001653CB27|nr:hypothetical protein [Caulobacter sp. 17J80-11]MBC6981381.1 hypothetical protein [Caulobacter sp. 17J80-11]
MRSQLTFAAAAAAIFFAGAARAEEPCALRDRPDGTAVSDLAVHLSVTPYPLYALTRKGACEGEFMLFELAKDSQAEAMWRVFMTRVPPGDMYEKRLAWDADTTVSGRLRCAPGAGYCKLVVDKIADPLAAK